MNYMQHAAYINPTCAELLLNSAKLNYTLYKDKLQQFVHQPQLFTTVYIYSFTLKIVLKHKKRKVI